MNANAANNKLIVILGPTASGKTGLSIKLAKKVKGEIVSADSRQIYRGLNIGTAKPTKKEMRGIPHHLIDIRNPNQTYTLWQFKKDAVQKIREIIKKGKVPFLVGGTGLYIKAVVDNLEIPRVKPDQKLRKALEKEVQKKGLKSVYDKLVKIDPEAAYIVDRNNPRRVIRALEIALKAPRDKPFSSQRKKGEPLFDILQIGLFPGKEKLKKIIDTRLKKMVKAGLIKEVKNLIRVYNENLPVFDAIGYREIIGYLQKQYSLAQSLENIKKNTWGYARRQMTWFKKDPEGEPTVPYGAGKRIVWLENYTKAEKLVKEFLSK